jgi:hypothetical protein
VRGGGGRPVCRQAACRSTDAEQAAAAAAQLHSTAALQPNAHSTRTCNETRSVLGFAAADEEPRPSACAVLQWGCRRRGVSVRSLRSVFTEVRHQCAVEGHARADKEEACERVSE